MSSSDSEEHLPAPHEALNCPYCPFEGRSAPALLNHLRRRHAEQGPRWEGCEQLFEDSEAWVCPVCAQPFLSRRSQHRRHCPGHRPDPDPPSPEGSRVAVAPLSPAGSIASVEANPLGPARHWDDIAAIPALRAFVNSVPTDTVHPVKCNTLPRLHGRAASLVAHIHNMVLGAWLSDVTDLYPLKLYAMLPRMLLKTASAASGSVQQRIKSNCDQFLLGQWEQLWDLPAEARRPPPQPTMRSQIRTAMRLIKQGELSKAVRMGTSSGLYHFLRGEPSAEHLQSKFPQQPEPDVSNVATGDVVVDPWRVKATLSMLDNCSAADGWGW